jgi:hypothetical protein
MMSPEEKSNFSFSKFMRTNHTVHWMVSKVLNFVSNFESMPLKLYLNMCSNMCTLLRARQSTCILCISFLGKYFLRAIGKKS